MSLESHKVQCREASRGFHEAELFTYIVKSCRRIEVGYLWNVSSGEDSRGCGWESHWHHFVVNWWPGGSCCWSRPNWFWEILGQGRLSSWHLGTCQPPTPGPVWRSDLVCRASPPHQVEPRLVEAVRCEGRPGGTMCVTLPGLSPHRWSLLSSSFGERSANYDCYDANIQHSLVGVTRGTQQMAYK